MFKELQEEVGKLEDYARIHSKEDYDDIKVILKNLYKDVTEIEEVVLSEKEKTHLDDDNYELAKELSDVVISVLRIARIYDIQMDPAFEKRLSEIKVKIDRLKS